jgi:hypothetical protein
MGSLPVVPTLPAGQLVTAGQLLSITNALSFLTNPPRCSLVQNNSQSFSANVRTAVTWDSENYDSDGMHSTSTNNNRTTCQTAGLYSVKYEVAFDATTTGATYQSFLMLNGGYFPGASDFQESVANDFTMLKGNVDIQLSVGDYLEVHVNPSVASSSKGLFLSNSTTFSARWVASS